MVHTPVQPKAPISLETSSCEEIQLSDKSLQVLDARTAQGEIVSEDTIAFGGVTILSAESFYNLHSFKLKDYTSLQFSTCGFDSKLTDYAIMKIEYTEYGPGSFLTATSPILTLYTETYRVFASFNYTINKETTTGTRNLKAMSNTAVMSPGWINSSQSFPTNSLVPFHNMNLKYSESKALIIKLSSNGFQPGEHLVIQAGTSDDQSYNSWRHTFIIRLAQFLHTISSVSLSISLVTRDKARFQSYIGKNIGFQLALLSTHRHIAEKRKKSSVWLEINDADSCIIPSSIVHSFGCDQLFQILRPDYADRFGPRKYYCESSSLSYSHNINLRTLDSKTNPIAFMALMLVKREALISQGISSSRATRRLGTTRTAQALFIRIPSSLYDLADSNTTTNLLPHVVMKSPIVITDNNTAQTARYPFTIWIVTIDKLMPVYDAKSMNGLISPEDTIAYGGITVLSAEPFFNMYAFTMRTLTYMQFATCGYDAYLNEYQVMKIETNDYGPSSFGSFSTPILTLFTESYSVYTKFSFTFDKDNRFGLHTLNTKSTTAAISPGWLNSTQSFPYEYPIAPFSNNSFKFNENRVLLILIKADGFLPGESLLVQAGTQDDQTYQNWSITTPMDKSYASNVHDFLHFLVIYTFFLVLT
ncbi:hypothetical protein PRIPAC_73818 [Pristionchus pacificus]|uniref:Uncharacterized protein n=1 Tax=Pristionchus pacificus TaxID=54126 RepID=A0A2A6B4P8_PRIPA|nr:hypothetical protein PRIPAC_73818 [Pristionchus pacificus]|eukprot:PDM60847.1 hypothetical protein PRIPAC_54653 [Pristionchus pacificus]